MILESERHAVVEYGKKMAAIGLTSGTGGNLSVVDRAAERMAISPSGIDYGRMRPEDVVVLHLKDGGVVDGERTPSSEFNFHLFLYQKRTDVGAVVHTHSPYATTMACLQWEIPPVHYLVGYAGKKVPVAPYATFGTEELARNVAETIGDYNALLMANHGLVAVGPNLATAFAVAEEIEFVARIYYQTRCVGLPPLISGEEMDRVLEKFKTYGQAK